MYRTIILMPALSVVVGLALGACSYPSAGPAYYSGHSYYGYSVLDEINDKLDDLQDKLNEIEFERMMNDD